MKSGNSNPEQNIYLVGFMGAGKSTVGELLAKALDFHFLDTDNMIEEQQKRSVAEIFSEKGERYFRELERQAIQEVARHTGTVVALGGGAYCDEVNRQMIKRSGISIYLKWPLSTLRARVTNDAARPMLAQNEGLKDGAGLEKLFEERKALYETADGIVVCEASMTPEQVVRSIQQCIKEEQL